jgi:hypothetical protein
MSIDPVQTSRGSLTVAAARQRQTERTPSPFRVALATGVNVLMSGAETVGSVVGGPILAAAVRGAGNDVTGGSGGPAGGGRTLEALPPDAAAVATGGADFSRIEALQRESQAYNLQLLELQEEVQQENRRFSTVSNVLRAKHDTAHAAINNVHT